MRGQKTFLWCADGPSMGGIPVGFAGFSKRAAIHTLRTAGEVTE